MQMPRINDHQMSRNRHIIVSALVMSVISIIIVALFQIMYNGAKQNILNIWENNVIQLAKSTEYYLARPADAIEFSASNVEDMFAEGASNEEIGDYLIREMDVYASLIENNYTGVYGYCRGEYLDASGWVPDADYEPKDRPWYRAAKENGGKVTLVSPFLNLQTNEMMMSISKLLSDGESVLSIDIYMDGLQKTLDVLASENGVKLAFLVDDSGTVIVHSDRSETGKNYISDGSEYQKELVARAKAVSEQNGYYEESDFLVGEVMFAEKIADTWCAVLVLNEASMLSSIRYLNLTLILFLMAAVIIWYVINRRINRKYREAEQLSQEVAAVADIYEAMTLIDLKTDQMTLLRSNADHDRVLDGNFSDFSKRTVYFAKSIASDSDAAKDVLIQFMDPSTYEERLKDVRSVSYDFLSAKGRWLRIQLIVVDRDQKGSLRHILWAIESIDQERKQQEQLRKLAETDPLSKLNNRRSGEARIRSMLEQKTAGAFILLDIDDFKSINDKYGHVVGDLVISAVADCLRQAFDESDIVFRLGGDEFAVFVPGIEYPDAVEKLIRQLHLDVERIRIAELLGNHVSVSIGASVYSSRNNVSFEALYQQADDSMYRDKRRKRDAEAALS